MKSTTVLATFISVAMAIQLNETHVWYVSDLVIKHQTGLPSAITFNVTDGFKGTAEPVACESYDGNTEILDTTIIPDVSDAECDNPDWTFGYVSFQPNPDEPPSAGKLTISQTLSLTSRALGRSSSGSSEDARTFKGSLVVRDFKRAERSRHDSAIIRFVGTDESIVTAT